MIKQRSHTLASLLLLSLALPAWMSATVVTGEGNPAVNPRPSRTAATTLRVTNDNPEAVSVVMVHEGDEYPVGTVDSKATRVFQVPSDVVGAANVTVLVTPLVDKPIDMSEEFQSAPMMLAAGQEAVLYVARHAVHSTLDGMADVNALASRGATLRITNHNPQAVSIVMLGADGEYPLGVAHTNKTRVFEVPSALVGIPNVKVVATRITDKPIDGSEDFQSAPITLATGHEAILVVAGPETQSKLTLN